MEHPRPLRVRFNGCDEKRPPPATTTPTFQRL